MYNFCGESYIVFSIFSQVHATGPCARSGPMGCVLKSLRESTSSTCTTSAARSFTTCSALLRYLQLEPARAAGQWDACLADATREYEQHMYNFCGDNCHCYVALFLNDAGYEGCRCADAHCSLITLRLELWDGPQQHVQTDSGVDNHISRPADTHFPHPCSSYIMNKRGQI